MTTGSTRARGPSRDRPPFTLTEEGLVAAYSDGSLEVLRWADLVEVAVRTTSEGPFVDDIFWELMTATKRCTIPSETEGTEALLERLQELPGFKNEVYIQAMMCTDDARFVVWP